MIRWFRYVHHGDRITAVGIGVGSDRQTSFSVILVAAEPENGGADEGNQDNNDPDSNDGTGDGSFLPEHLFPFIGELHDNIGDLVRSDGVGGGEERRRSAGLGGDRGGCTDGKGIWRKLGEGKFGVVMDPSDSLLNALDLEDDKAVENVLDRLWNKNQYIIQ